MARMVPVRESRVRAERTSEGLRIDVARRKTLMHVVMPIWAGVILTFGTVGLVTSETPADDAGAVAFLAVWFGIAASIAALSLWSLLYREKLLLDARALTHRRRLGPVRRERNYARERIEDLRVSP